MGISIQQLAVLEAVAPKVDVRDAETYLALKELLGEGGETSREAFKLKYTRYYGMNQAGLTDEFRERYFELLFSFDVETPDPHARIIRALFDVEDRQRRRIPCFSFASKLVSIHDETQPVFDRHVSGFFGIAPPGAGTLDFRIEGFAANLCLIRNIYGRWIEDRSFKDLSDSVYQRIPGLRTCRQERLCDLLVWTAGRLHSASKRMARQES